MNIINNTKRNTNYASDGDIFYIEHQLNNKTKYYMLCKDGYLRALDNGSVWNEKAIAMEEIEFILDSLLINSPEISVIKYIGACNIDITPLL